jgi:flagellar hook protein FlgE
MSISGIMRTAASGMDAQSNRLSTVADNIANASTNGYKRSHCEFSSFIPNRTTFAYESGSVITDVRCAVSAQGNLTGTTSVTDLAVNGNGFLVVSNNDGANFLTRAGSFVEDGDGALVNAAGFYLMGYPIENGDISNVVNGTAGLEKVVLGDLSMQTELSKSGLFYANLPSNDPAVTVLPSVNTNAVVPAECHKSSIVVYANLGNQVTLDLWWAKTSNPDEWQLAVFDKNDVSGNANPFPYTSPDTNDPTVNNPLVTGLYTFDSVTGAMTTVPANIIIPVPNGFQTDGGLVLDLSKTTQLAGDYVVQNAKVDGNGPSAVSSVEIDTSGVLYAVYEDGARIATYQIPLGTVPSPDNMKPLPGDVFTPTTSSGDLLIGIPTQGGFGLVVSSTLEQSTVDLASELTDLIEAQRSYEINSKVFQTGDEVLQVIVNLKR